MADDIQDLDTSLLFRIPVNYQDDVTGKMNIFREILQFDGTTQEIIEKADINPRTYQLEFLLYDKQKDYEFLEFVHSVRGEAKKFWFISEERAFELVSVIGSLDTSFIVEANNFDGIHKGNERVCFRLYNGDIIIRKITDVSTNNVDDTHTLQTGVTFDRVIELSDVQGIFFVVPVRIENPQIVLSNDSKEVSVATLTFQEILTEYPA